VLGDCARIVPARERRIHPDLLASAVRLSLRNDCERRHAPDPGSVLSSAIELNESHGEPARRISA
jgi:hypothetical protein